MIEVCAVLGGGDTAAALEALDEDQLEQGAWDDENVLDLDGRSENDIDAVGNEYEGGDEDDDNEGWEMEASQDGHIHLQRPVFMILDLAHLPDQNFLRLAGFCPSPKTSFFGG